MTDARTPIVLCADDYGLSPGVGRSIRTLIAEGRLTATSCMTLCPGWSDEAARLKPLDGLADIGLHLTLTDHPPLGPMPRLAPDGRLPPLGLLMRRAFAGGLDPREIAAELERQLDAFTVAYGRAPDHIDGHQHVHQLPVVREAVVEALARRPGAYVRLCREPRRTILRRRVAVAKTLLISELGNGLAALAAAAGIPANARFRGVYDFGGAMPFPDLMERFLDAPEPRTLVMVHPGFPDAALRAADPLVEPRRGEHDHLSGPAFAEQLERKRVRLVRFREGRLRDRIQPGAAANVQ